jgi:uncharacterized protein YbjT (DUF2867 family)
MSAVNFPVMRVGIAGGHGQIALLLASELREGGDEVVSLIRNPDHTEDVREAGGEPVVLDLEHADEDEVAGAIRGLDAVVFAAGAGPGSGPERKTSMDYGGAVKLIAAAKAAGVPRYVMVSSIGADPEAEGEEGMAPYQRAKGRADRELEESGLDWTIVKPGMLTNAPRTGFVEAGEEQRAEVARGDVASVLAAVLRTPSTVGRSFAVVGGETPVQQAVEAL